MRGTMRRPRSGSHLVKRGQVYHDRRMARLDACMVFSRIEVTCSRGTAPRSRFDPGPGCFAAPADNRPPPSPIAGLNLTRMLVEVAPYENCPDARTLAGAILPSLVPATGPVRTIGRAVWPEGPIHQRATGTRRREWSRTECRSTDCGLWQRPDRSRDTENLTVSRHEVTGKRLYSAGSERRLLWIIVRLLFGGVAMLAWRRMAASIAKASMTSEACRCQPCQERVSLWSRPNSFLAVSKLSSMAQRCPSTVTKTATGVPAGHQVMKKARSPSAILRRIRRPLVHRPARLSLYSAASGSASSR